MLDNQIRLLMAIVTERQARIREHAQVEHAIGHVTWTSKAPVAQDLAKTNLSSRDTRRSFATGRP